MRRALGGAIVLLVLLIGIGPAMAAPDPGSAESQFLGLLNDERVRAGHTPLTRDGALDGVAREWSTTMMREDRLYHRPNLVDAVDTRVTRSWTRIGENVGVGGSVERLHQAFMNSPGHKANVLGAYNRVGVGVVVEGDGTIWVTFNFMNGPATGAPTGTVAAAPAPAIPPKGDFWLVGADGSVFAYGSAGYAGSMGGKRLAAPIVGMAPTPSGKGYWLVASDGGIFSFGDARFHGSTGALRLSQPIVGIAATPTGNGYWLVARDGGIFAFGDAKFRGSTGSLRLNRPIVGMAPTSTGSGYWLVASDGGIFAFGDAVFRGSTGNIRLARPINGMAASPSGRGYYLVADDGGIFTFGDAAFFGSTGGRPLPASIAQIGVTPTGKGYWLAGRDGRVYAFGDAGSGTSGPVSTAAGVVALSVA
jgi:ribosomal protein L24E